MQSTGLTHRHFPLDGRSPWSEGLRGARSINLRDFDDQARPSPREDRQDQSTEQLS